MLVEDALLGVLLLFSLPVPAATLTVDGSGGGDFATIQAAVDAASPGDSILVQAGLYVETVRIASKGGLLVRGEPGPEFVTVQGDSLTLGIWNTQTPVRIEGLTLTGGSVFGALRVQGARVLFTGDR